MNQETNSSMQTFISHSLQFIVQKAKYTGSPSASFLPCEGVAVGVRPKRLDARQKASRVQAQLQGGYVLTCFQQSPFIASSYWRKAHMGASINFSFCPNFPLFWYMEPKEEKQKENTGWISDFTFGGVCRFYFVFSIGSPQLWSCLCEFVRGVVLTYMNSRMGDQKPFVLWTISELYRHKVFVSFSPSGGGPFGVGVSFTMRRDETTRDPSCAVPRLLSLKWEFWYESRHQ